jgi:hypothetical protein
MPTAMAPFRIGQKTAIANTTLIIKPIMKVQTINVVGVKAAPSRIVPRKEIQQVRFEVIAIPKKNDIRLPRSDRAPESFAEMIGVEGEPAEMDFLDKERKLPLDMPARVIIGPDRNKEPDFESAAGQARHDFFQIDPTPADRWPVEGEVDKRDSNGGRVWRHVDI